jgi:hypothetical protein
LTAWWFKGRLSVADIYQLRWNAALNVNEWTMEFIDGRPALLRQPFSAPHEDEITDLVVNVMRPLQQHLVEAGFDGAAWQAGLYNPVATSNFLRRSKRDGGVEWVWIDVESGVPALFPANPLGLLRYYLPRSFKFGRPLFDDVDVAKLRLYLATHEREMRRDLGNETWSELASTVDDFAAASANSLWKRLGRVGRGIEARLRRREITPSQAEYYSRHKARWVLREAGVAASGLARSALRRLAAWFHPRLWWTICRESVRLVLSDAHRTRFARRYVASSIERWRNRKQLTATEADMLTGELNGSGSANYLTDFGMHLATKPLVKLVTWVGVPALYALGMMNELTLAILVIGGGAIVRTLYTMIRIVSAYRFGHSRPWIALLTGTLPVLGNVAFPLQLLFDGVSGGRQLARFIVYDTASRVGRSIPIWGGADTLTEHRANRAADRLFALAHKVKAFLRPAPKRTGPLF